MYRVLVCLALPLVFGYFFWRGRREPAYRKRWGERLGFGATVPGQPLWIHAASVGEAALAEPLVRALRERNPNRSIVVTTFTPTGAERVRERLGDAVSHRYLPLDTVGATRRFIRRVNPCGGVIVETELWPNLLHAAARAKVPVALVNASVSPRSAGRYGSRWLAPLMQEAMVDIVAIGAASKAHAQRFVALGAAPGTVQVTGNLKYDMTPEPEVREQGAQTRVSWHAQHRPLWTAASTHEGEEALLLAAHRELLSRYSDALLVLAPRHPQRFTVVAEILARDGWTYASHAEHAAVTADTQVILGDTLGDVPRFYAAADVTFVGGSIVPGTGGHNVLEAALLARPVLIGPHVDEWQDVCDGLVAAGGAIVVHTAADMAQQLAQWFGAPDAAATAGQRAQAAAQDKQGALKRTLALLDNLSR